MPAAEHLRAASDFGKRPASSAASLRRAGRFVAPLSTAQELMSIVVRVHPAAATPWRGPGVSFRESFAMFWLRPYYPGTRQCPIWSNMMDRSIPVA